MIDNSLISVAWCYVLYGRNVSTYYSAMNENIKLARNNNFSIIIATLKNDYAFVNDYFRDDLDVVKIICFSDDVFSSSAKLLRYVIPIYFTFDFYLFKDTDSIVTDSEIDFSIEWIRKREEGCIIFRDHPLHVSPILGGMFGLSRTHALELALTLKDRIVTGDINLKHRYLYDQLWLGEYLYPKIRNNSVVYTSFLYYSGENVVNTFSIWNQKRHIGSQHFFDETQVRINISKYIDLYQNELLYVPFIKCVAPIYQRARIVIYFGIIYRFIRKNIKLKLKIRS